MLLVYDKSLWVDEFQNFERFYRMLPVQTIFCIPEIVLALIEIFQNLSKVSKKISLLLY